MEEVYIKQIEEWTNRKVGNILFDSDKDDWNVNKSVFDQRIMNKEHIIIIIEDEEGNKFGGYVNSKIDEVDDCIYDPYAFKFDIEYPQYAFYLYKQSCDCLFKFGCGYGSDSRVFKENYKTQSYCYQQDVFSYKGISNALCGKEYPNSFTPTRIIVIEMK
ncbi:trichohyalin, putative [Entamoeba histolytica]